MGYKLIETRLASQDLDNILEYMAVRLQNPAAASAFADAVEQCYDLLEHTPLMYEACRDLRLRAKGYRKAVIRNYVLIYKVDEKNQTSMKRTGPSCFCGFSMANRTMPQNCKRYCQKHPPVRTQAGVLLCACAWHQ